MSCSALPGFGPESILSQAARTARYSDPEIRALAFDGPPPDAAALSREWHEALDVAREVIALLPPDEVGTCVLADDGVLFRGDPSALRRALQAGGLRYHRGTIRGALPVLLPQGLPGSS